MPYHDHPSTPRVRIEHGDSHSNQEYTRVYKEDPQADKKQRLVHASEQYGI